MKKKIKAFVNLLDFYRSDFLTCFDIQLDLFDKVVLPVLLYSCKIWGYENIDVIERVHLRFLKHILKSSTPSFMVYG